jgi:hypothetical protein
VELIGHDAVDLPDGGNAILQVEHLVQQLLGEHLGRGARGDHDAVLHGDQALGVIELAALEPFDDHTRTLLESLASPLAYALMAAVGREEYIRRHRQEAG